MILQLPHLPFQSTVLPKVTNNISTSSNGERIDFILFDISAPHSALCHNAVFSFHFFEKSCPFSSNTFPQSTLLCCYFSRILPMLFKFHTVSWISCSSSMVWTISYTEAHLRPYVEGSRQLIPMFPNQCDQTVISAKSVSSSGFCITEHNTHHLIQGNVLGSG